MATIKTPKPGGRINMPIQPMISVFSVYHYLLIEYEKLCWTDFFLRFGFLNTAVNVEAAKSITMFVSNLTTLRNYLETQCLQTLLRKTAVKV